jgi:predicted ATP-dependent serine protease
MGRRKEIVMSRAHRNNQRAAKDLAARTGLGYQQAFQAITRKTHPSNGGPSGVKFGVAGLDQRLGPDGPPLGQMMALLAKSGAGKTSFLTGLAAANARRMPVLFLTLEAPAANIQRRLDRAEPIKLHRRSLHIIDETGRHMPATVDDVEERIVEVRASEGSCPLVIVDHLHLLAPADTEPAAGEAAQQLSAIARRRQAFMVVAAHLPRAAVHGERAESPPAFTDQFDIVAQLWRPHYDSDDFHERLDWQIGLDRHGSRDDLPATLDVPRSLPRMLP